MIGKLLFWLGSSRGDIRRWPKDARRGAGHELRLVQRDLEPHDWKPMPRVGLGVYEIRIRTSGEHRVFYVTKFREGIYVLHAFRKRTRATSRGDIQLARQRLSNLLVLRKSRGPEGGAACEPR